MLFAGKTMLVTANQVTAVRLALPENQTEFAQRFSRSRFAIIRWEQDGVKFKYQSVRWHRWQDAVERAIQLSISRGLPDEQVEHLRALRFFPPKQ